MLYKSIIGATCTCLAVVSFNASATVIDFGEWNVFQWSGFGSVQVHQPSAAAVEDGRIIEYGVDPGPAPWEFTTVEYGAVLRIQDSIAPGDVFEAFSFGVSLGLTSEPAPVGTPSDGSDFNWDQAALNPIYSQGAFFIPAFTDVSLTITVAVNPFGNGAGAFRVDPVPVPAAVWLFSSGLLGLIGVARRRAGA